MNISKKSLFILLISTTIIVVSILMSIQAFQHYKHSKEKLIKQIIYDTQYIGLLLQNNLTQLISSFSINEYENLIAQAMKHKDSFAIIIEDYNMGKVMGVESYFTGKIRNTNWDIINLDKENKSQVNQLSKAFYFNTYEINDKKTGHKIALIKIYMSDRFLNEELDLYLYDTLVSTFIFTLILIISLLIIANIFVIKPLTRITDIIRHPDNEGLPVDTIPITGSSEISLLANQMNKMIATIRQSNHKIKEQHLALLSKDNILYFTENFDALTGLSNRTRFNEMINNAINDDQTIKFAVFIIGIDNFKTFNDSFGLEIGDNVLKTVTQRLQASIKNIDAIARIGGDEFAVLVDNFKNEDELGTIPNIILNSLQKPIIINEHEVYISASIGISTYPNDGSESLELLKNADAALYKAKNEGKNNFQFYSSNLTDKALERIILESNIRSAIKNSEFIQYYQPQINAKNNTLIGMEVLVRWQNPKLGLVSPAKFIPLAEITGLIVDIDRLTMKATLEQLCQWKQSGLHTGKVSINLSIKNLQAVDFIDFVKSLIKQTGCKPEWIEFEVTESQIMTDPLKAINVLTQISELGIRISVDDFGTGHSSLSYLKKLPINKLKIDQSFVRNLPDDNKDIAITKAIIVLATSLNIELIAEGVETEEQKDFLVREGCENIQGYFYSKPIPAEEMSDFLNR
ncbi:MAG: EAL domain-containing protein [Gammaproteobacteria bacterium]|nr:EAL domain-containing protein [Gammaproteobacteria bacterium]